MYDYMRALHARFCREPELQKAREELEQAYREIKARLGQQDQETLLQLADLGNELREEASLTSFIAGFRLGMGIAGEIAYDRLSAMDGNASYRTYIIDAVDRMTPEKLEKGARYEVR